MDVCGTDFDLLANPWIPVIRSDGSRASVGLRECLAEAPRIREIVDPSPLVTFAYHRVLGAILQAYVPLPDLDAWADAWGQGCFSTEVLASVDQRLRGKLQLFDRVQPFYQSNDILGEPVPKEAKTVGYLWPEASTGTNVTHFSHLGDAQHADCPACCARALICLPPFATAGGSGIKPSINGAPPTYVLPLGTNLFETLLLNYVVPMFQPNQRSPRDPGPCWDGCGMIGDKSEHSEVGFIESLTWPPRRVRLFPGSGGVCSRCGAHASTLVRRIVYAQGQSRPKDLPPWDDPWATYAEVEKAGQTTRHPIRPRGDRDTWRDFSSMFLTRPASANTQTRFLRPSVLRQIDQLLAEEYLSPTASIHFATVGLRTDLKAKIFEWRADSFVFPPVLLRGEASWASDEALRAAEGANYALNDGIRTLHPVAGRVHGDPKAKKEANEGIRIAAARRYWRELEGVFREAIGDPSLLDARATQAQWLTRWKNEVRQAAISAFEEVLDSFDADFEGLKAQSRARAVFYGSLKKRVESPTPDVPADASDDQVADQ